MCNNTHYIQEWFNRQEYAPIKFDLSLLSDLVRDDITTWYIEALGVHDITRFQNKLAEAADELFGKYPLIVKTIIRSVYCPALFDMFTGELKETVYDSERTYAVYYNWMKCIADQLDN